jgi:hypothetical protein
MGAVGSKGLKVVFGVLIFSELSFAKDPVDCGGKPGFSKTGDAIALKEANARAPSITQGAARAQTIDQVSAKIHVDFVRFVDEEITYLDWQKGLFEAFDSLGVPPEFRTAFQNLDQYQARTLLGNYKNFFKVAISSDLEKQGYLLDLAKKAGTSSVPDLDKIVSRIDQVFSYPKGPKVSPFDTSTGGLGEFFEGTLEGKKVLFKADRSIKDSMVVSELEVLEGIQKYGAPKTLGIFRIQDSRGIWREALAMEKIEGAVSVLGFRNMKAAGKKFPFPITDKHRKAIENLEAQLRKNGESLEETNLGDFLLTPDPNRPLVIVDMFVKPGVARNHNGVLGHDGRSVLSHLSEIAAP